MSRRGSDAGRLARVASALLFGLSALAPGTLTAQEPPDLSGPWTASPGGRGGRGGSANADLGSGWGRNIVLEQQGDTLIVERTFFAPGDLQPPIRLRFALDGSESRNTVMMGRGIQEQISRARWEGDRLVIDSTWDSPTEGGRTITSGVRHTLWLERPSYPARPPTLVIETVRAGVLGGHPSTTRTVYSRG